MAEVCSWRSVWSAVYSNQKAPAVSRGYNTLIYPNRPLIDPNIPPYWPLVDPKLTPKCTSNPPALVAYTVYPDRSAVTSRGTGDRRGNDRRRLCAARSDLGQPRRRQLRSAPDSFLPFSSSTAFDRAFFVFFAGSPAIPGRSLTFARCRSFCFDRRRAPWVKHAGRWRSYVPSPGNRHVNPLPLPIVFKLRFH